MTPNNPTPALRRIREKAPHRRSVSLTYEHITRLSYLEILFTALYTEEGPFSFSKTVSKAVDLANLVVIDPKLRFVEEQIHQEFVHYFPPTFRRIRKKAPYRRSMSLTDEDIQRLSDLEKTFTTIYSGEVPFSISKTVSKAVDIATTVAVDPRLPLEQREKKYIQEFYEEHKEQLKHEIENGVLYKLNVIFYRKYVAELKASGELQEINP